ncbi:hypothetical protein [Planomonospora sp. ID82291]|uniref:hypothetical protein n=1 Tax=Planomonospora sp. ID82291 TaxID=2738136 RepID=UPI0018C37383|nr:hypothetical protein [Planomonospora sp. ID82291]MBG0816009.1 hypothetical protein [Planomonospora sp. ID82291]
MTSPQFTGVRQPEFDTMTGRHAQAAERLERLAQALYGELRGAGLDTSPAVRLRELSRRVATQAEDLRRRQDLIRKMEQQKVGLGMNTPSGTVFTMPDSLDAARGLLDGTVAGRAALDAVDGNSKALAQLEKYASRTGDAEFIKAFLTTLGAGGVTRLPGSLAAQLRDAAHHGDAGRVAQLSTQGKKTLSMLGAALAKGTDPKSPAYLGGGFLKNLTKQGRAEHRSGDVKYSGYQAQALIWRAHDGKPPFSEKFMEVVGRDVIAYEKDDRAEEWAAGKDLLGRAVGGAQVPVFDLAGALGLGTLLRTGPGTASDPGKKGPPLLGDTARSSIVDGLFQAAGSNREAAHALLDHTPAGWKESVLDHLLTTRWDAFRYLGEYRSFSDLLTTATTGQDPTSRKLAAELTKLLADEVRPAFTKGDDGNLAFKDPAPFERLAPLRYPLARAIAANIDQLSQLLHSGGTFPPEDSGARHKVSATDMLHALALATSDDAGFEALVRAQTEHMRQKLESVPPVGLSASNAGELGFTEAQFKEFDRNRSRLVDADDVQQFLTDAVAAEARPFSSLLETRQQVLIAQEKSESKAGDALKAIVREGIGMFPVPGSRQVGEQVGQAFSGLVTGAYDKLTGLGYDELSKQIGQRAAEQGRTMDETYKTLADDRLAVERLAEQMIATAMLSKGMLDEVDLEDRTFTAGDPPKIKPFATMTPKEYNLFLRWVQSKGGSHDLLERFRGASAYAKDVESHLGVQIPPPSGGSK